MKTTQEDILGKKINEFGGFQEKYNRKQKQPVQNNGKSNIMKGCKSIER